MQESKYYSIVKKWLEESGYIVGLQKGIEGAGQADVVGFTVIGNEFQIEPEIVAVEVKTSGRGLGRKATQSRRYSLFANYPYAAVKFNRKDTGFSDKDIELARQLGIGLIEIRRDVKVVLSPPRHSPPMANLLKVIRKLGYVQCAICKSFVKRDTAYKQGRKTDLMNKERIVFFCKPKCTNLLNLPKKAKK